MVAEIQGGTPSHLSDLYCYLKSEDVGKVTVLAYSQVVRVRV